MTIAIDHNTNETIPLWTEWYRIDPELDDVTAFRHEVEYQEELHPEGIFIQIWGEAEGFRYGFGWVTEEEAEQDEDEDMEEELQEDEEVLQEDEGEEE